MWEILYLLLLIVFIAAAIIAGALLWRSYVESGAPGSGIFRSKNEKRLAVVDQASLDGRRRLVLIRRDDTEHLIMTGGPVDVVIETGIESGLKADRKARTGSSVVETPVFSRSSRALGQAAGDQ
jgi:flagellar protein FliO/FliZ